MEGVKHDTVIDCLETVAGSRRIKAPPPPGGSPRPIAGVLSAVPPPQTPTPPLALVRRGPSESKPQAQGVWRQAVGRKGGCQELFLEIGGNSGFFTCSREEVNETREKECLIMW